MAEKLTPDAVQALWQTLEGLRAEHAAARNLLAQLQSLLSPPDAHHEVIATLTAGQGVPVECGFRASFLLADNSLGTATLHIYRGTVPNGLADGAVAAGARTILRVRPSAQWCLSGAGPVQVLWTTSPLGAWSA